MRHVKSGRALALLFLVVGVLAAVETWRRIPVGTPANPGPGMFPLVLAVALAVLAAAAGLARQWPALPAPAVGRTVAVATLLVGYPLALPRLGFGLTTALVLFLLSRGLAPARPLRLALFAIVASAAAVLLFRKLLAVPLPQGPWGF